MNKATGINNPDWAKSTAQPWLSDNLTKSKVPEKKNKVKIPMRNETSPTRVMRKALLPACVGENARGIPQAFCPTVPT